MKQLKLDFWKDYFWDHKFDKFDGVKFEDLVAELLVIEYPPVHLDETWKRTEKSWDGKRDFFQLYTENGKELMRWAECKAYQNAITFNILAPTLIMSTLRDTNEVIFFSYSPLNREAVRALQEFAMVNGKRVRVYDDERLEQLIFRHKDHAAFRFSTFFPRFGEDVCGNTNHFPINSSADAYIYQKNVSYHIGTLKKQKLRINELFELRICLSNQTLEEQRVRLEFDMSRNNIYQFLDAEDRSLHIIKEITLQGGEVVSVPFPFKVTGFSKQIHLPLLNIVCGGQHCSCDLGFFLGSWLLETPYFGDMEQFAAFSAATTCCYETVCTVFGPSGAGKSRYLREMQGHRMMIGKKCIWSDAAHTNGKVITWLKQLLSKLYALPLIHVEAYAESDFPDVEARIITDVLYDTDFHLSETQLEHLSAVILKALVDQDVLLIVDNVQDFDDDTIRILNHMISLLAGAPGAHLLLSFNTDLLYKQEIASALLLRLKQLARDDGDHYFLHHIQGLRKCDETLFIRSCFLSRTAVQDDSTLVWQPILKQIADLAEGNPLYLEQLLLHLCENSILKIESGHLYVFDNHSLPRHLASVPTSIQELLDKRWIMLRKSVGSIRAKVEEVLRFLCFFGVLPSEMIQELSLEESAIDVLVEAGFLRHENGLTFYHSLVEKYFRKKYPSLLQREMKQCVQVLDVNGLREEFPGQFYLCLLRYRSSSAKRIDAAIDTLISGKVPAPLNQPYSQALFGVLKRNPRLMTQSTKRILQFFIAYGEQKKRDLPLSEVLKNYSDIYHSYLQQFSDFRQFGEYYFRFAKEYLNALLSEHQNTAAAKLGETLLASISEYTFASSLGLQRAKAMLYNRMHVAYDRLEPSKAGVPDSPHAQELLKKALDISRRINDPDRIIQNEIDFGYVFYLFGGSAQAAAEHWQSAHKIWISNAEAVPLWEGGVYYHKALAHTILHQWKDAESSLEQVFRFHNKTLHNPYFYVKALTLRALLLLISREAFRTVLNAVNEAEDACTESGYIGIFPFCSHIRALAYDLLLGNQTVAADYYEKALTQHINRCEQKYEEERNLNSMLTLALALRRTKGRTRCAAVTQLKSRTAERELTSVLESDDSEWKSICQKPAPRGLLYLEEVGINYPCL